MTTLITESLGTETIGCSPLYCDKCGRPIPSGKGYTIINGWIICGICQYESELEAKNQFKNKKL